MRSKRSFNKCNDLDLNEIKSNQWQDKEIDSDTINISVIEKEGTTTSRTAFDRLHYCCVYVCGVS